MAEKLLKTVFDWEHFAIYLSGAIDFANNGGRDWREDWTKRLVNMGINPKQIYNPCRKPLNGAQFNLNDEAALMKKCREKQDWDGLDEIMGQIMHIDLRLVDKADIILVNFPKVGYNDVVSHELKKLLKRQDIVSQSHYAEQIGQACSRYNDMRVPTYGTIHEIVVATKQHKPVFIVWEDEGKSTCSAWVMKLVGHKNVFSNVSELISHLSNISAGKTAFDANEWLLLDPK